MGDIIRSKQIYYIDSSQRISGDSSNFSVPIDIPENENYTEICVLEAIIPVSYYLINSYNNTFILQEPGAPDVTIAIPAGNYNINSFCFVVANLINNNSLQGWKYFMTYNKGFTDNFDGIITMTVTNNNGMQPSIVIPAKSTVIEQFGFGSIANVDQTFSFDASVLISTNVCNYINEPVIIIHSTLADNSGTDVLQAVYEGNNYQLSQISYQATEATMHAKKLRTPKSKLASFSLTDINNNPISLNGRDFTMTIVMYRKESFADWIKQLIKTILFNE